MCEAFNVTQLNERFELELRIQNNWKSNTLQHSVESKLIWDFLLESFHRMNKLTTEHTFNSFCRNEMLCIQAN